AKAQSGLAIALSDSGRVADSLKHFEAATRLAPQDPEGWLNLAICHARLEQFAPAVAAGEQALGLARPPSEDPIRQIVSEQLTKWRAQANLPSPITPSRPEPESP